MRITREVRAVNGNRLEQEGLASATVGADRVAPEIAISGQTQIPVILPGNGDFGVDQGKRQIPTTTPTATDEKWTLDAPCSGCSVAPTARQGSMKYLWG